MPHVERKQSESDMYHVIVRGVGQQIIFEDDEDRAYFMGVVDTMFLESRIELLAWCLMSNHVHLLIHAPIKAISFAMMKAESSYATYFNGRHQRTGTLFQGRFTSIPIDNESQLLSTLRYIHFNPVKSGGRIDSQWSSYWEYTALGLTKPTHAQTQFILTLLGGIEGFKDFHSAADSYRPPIPRKRLTESQALNVAREELGGTNPHALKTLDPEKRNALIHRLHDAGLSCRQIARITSIGLGIINRACRFSHQEEKTDCISDEQR